MIGGHALPDYDASYALVWARDIAHGHAPDYSLPYRPAGHPLTTAVALAGQPLGRRGAAEVLRWAALLGAGALAVSVFRLGQALFGTLTGAVAGLLLATRSALWGFSLLGYMDAWAGAFVVWAAVLEARVPRRGAAVFVLLGLAGLIRPEAWLFAGAYWVWIAAGSRGRALRLLPLALLGPLAWAVWDAATSQTLLGSLSTSTGLPAATSTAGHGVVHVPGAFARFVGGFVRPPELVAAAAGLVMLALSEARRALLPLALLALNVLAFVLVATRQGPLEQRYLLVAAAMMLVFAAYALAQVASERRGLRAVALVLAVGCVAYVPVEVSRVRRLHDQVRVAAAVYSQLRAELEDCPPGGRAVVPNVRLRPFVAWWGGIEPAKVVTSVGATTVVALDPLARELATRSLPADPDGAAPRNAWRVDGPCTSQ